MSQTAVHSRTQVQGTTREQVVRAVAAGASLVAALTHFWVVPEHLGEWLPAAVFFVVVGVAQLVLAWVLRHPVGPGVVGVAGAGTIGLVVLYVASRTVDLPFVPGAHDVSHAPIAWGIGNGVPVFPGQGIEEVGVPDMVCLGAELVLVAALTALAPPALRRLATNAVFGIALVMLALRLVGVLG